MTPNSLLYPCPSCQRGVCTYNQHSNSARHSQCLCCSEFMSFTQKGIKDQLVSPQVYWVLQTPSPSPIKMEDYVKILLLKILGQSFAVTFKSLFGKGERSICFNKMHFSFNECKRGHRKGLKASNIVGICCLSWSHCTSHHSSVDHCWLSKFRASKAPDLCLLTSSLWPLGEAISHRAWCHRNNYPLSDFPLSLNHFSLIFTCSTMAKGQTGATPKATEFPRHRSTVSACHHSGLLLLH